MGIQQEIQDITKIVDQMKKDQQKWWEDVHKRIPPEKKEEVKMSTKEKLLEEIRNSIKEFRKQENFTFPHCVRNLSNGWKIASQNPRGKSTVATEVATGKIKHWEAGWIWEEISGKRIWKYFYRIKDNKIYFTRL